MGIAPTGRSVEFSSMAFDRVVNSKIVDHNSQADWLGLRYQLEQGDTPYETEQSAEVSVHERNRAVVQQTNHDLYNEQKLVVLDSSFVLNDPEGYKRTLHEYFTAFPDDH
jgi:hypothetical protein